MNPVKSKSGNINYPNLDARHVEHFIKIADTDESSGSYFAKHIRAEKFKKLEK